MNAAIRLAAPLLVLIAAPVSGAHAQADEVVPYDLAISRLRACVTSGAAGAPRDSLHSAVIAVRSLCRPQIDRAYQAEGEHIAAQNLHADADQLTALRQKARRKIDLDLVRLVSNLIGLQQ